MKKLFIEVKSDVKFKLSKEDIEKLPKKIGLVTTVQFIDSLKDIKKQIEKTGRECVIGKDKQIYPGQILGCDAGAALAVKDKVDAFLYIGDGRFHPIEIKIKTEKEVFLLRTNNKLSTIEDKLISDYKRKIKAGLTKFFSSDNIGIINSTKPGQNRIKMAKDLEEKYKEKKFYSFVVDTLDFSQLENFPFIEAWVNCMCPRVAIDDFSKFNKPVINIDDLKNV